MAEIAWDKVSPGDRSRFGGWWWVITASAVDLALSLETAQSDARAGPWGWLVLGALTVACPVTAREIGRAFLGREVEHDWPFISMVGWRGLCLAIAALPVLLRLVGWPGR